MAVNVLKDKRNRFCLNVGTKLKKVHAVTMQKIVTFSTVFNTFSIINHLSEDYSSLLLASLKGRIMG
jgi:hypothetical protein